jgi:RNA polymerase sigma-70 factor (ECF subfamily)
LNDRSDEDLVVASRAGDSSAHATLVKRHYKHVFLVCLGILGNAHDAEDIAQDAMLKGFEQIRTLRDGAQFGRWVVTIARNLCLNLFRRRRYAKKTMEQAAAQPYQNPTENDNLQQAIEKLSQEFRLPLVMYYFDGQSVKTVAKRLNMSTSGVYTKLRTATKQLHEILVKQGDTQ